jgi:hypothetical protein
LLYDWLVEEARIDFTRKLSSFIDPFPEPFRRKVIDPDYRPDVDGLIDDYLADNPTRNRPLDMLPAFATLRHDRVLAAAKEHDQVKPRPTFHYRLPNCCVDDPAWTFAQEWNRWVAVERLAEDRVRLGAPWLAPTSPPTRPQVRSIRARGPAGRQLARRGRMSRPCVGVTGPDRGGGGAWWMTRLAIDRAGGKPRRITPSRPADIDGLDALVLGGGATSPRALRRDAGAGEGGRGGVAGHGRAQERRPRPRCCSRPRCISSAARSPGTTRGPTAIATRSNVTS